MPFAINVIVSLRQDRKFSGAGKGRKIFCAPPLWKELGTEAFIQGEEKLFTCSNCGAQLFRGARKCRKCGTVRE